MPQVGGSAGAAGNPTIGRPSISILVVTYNSAAVVSEALQSVSSLIDDGGEVIVVDNNSTDGTPAVVHSIDARIRLVSMPSNRGFSAAVNVGARLVSTSYLCLLNPDAVVDADALRALVGLCEADQSIGAIAPLVVQGDGRSGGSGAYRFPTRWRTFCTLWGLSLIAGPSWLEGTVLLSRQVTRARDVDWLTGACILIPTRVWRDVGGMTERWFMYAEDIDLGLRVQRLGRRVVVDPRFEVHHRVGGSSDRSSSELEAAWLVNQWDFYRTELAPSAWAAEVWRAIAVGGVGARALIHIALGRASRDHGLLSRGRWLWRCAAALRRAK